MHPSTGAHDARSFFAELARESRTGHFWMMVARNAVPPFGVIALGWPALQAAVVFVLESWVFLSLRCGIEITIDPKFNGGARQHGAWDYLKHIVVAFICVAIVLVMFAWVVLLSAFPPPEWSEFFATGWRQWSFIGAIVALFVLSIADAVGFVGRFATRSAEQAAADDGRVRVMFYRVLGLLLASWLLGFASQAGIGGPALVVAAALLSIYLEGLPDHASRTFGMSTHTRFKPKAAPGPKPRRGR